MALARHLPRVTRDCFRPRFLAVAARILAPVLSRITHHLSLIPAFFLLLIGHSSLVTAQITPQSVITTVAGGSWVFRGDGKPALEAPLEELQSLAVDAAGNVFASDSGNNLIVKIAPGGILTVVAGNGIRGFSGDGGAATSAALNSPLGMTVDAAGNLYIADWGNNRVRKVSSDGVITTLAGGGTASPGDGGPATAARLISPRHLAVDAVGNVYVAEGNAHRVRKVRPDGIITTVAGTGIQGFSGDGGPATEAALNFPTHVAVDAADSLYIADISNGRIRKVSPDGVISTFAAISGPFGLAVDASGNLYVSHGFRVSKVTPSGTVSPVAGTGSAGFSGDGGPATEATLNEPKGVAVDTAGNLYIGDARNLVLRNVTPDGIIRTVAGNRLFKYSGDGGPATSASLNVPGGVAADATGSFFVADLRNHRIRKVRPEGIITTVAGTGIPGFSGEGGPATSAMLTLPWDVAVDPAGGFYIAATGIYKAGADGIFRRVSGAGFSRGLAVDAAGNLFFAEQTGHRVRKLGPDGTITVVAGTGTAGFSGDGGPATSAMFNRPEGLAVDTAGNVYVADSLNHRIRRISSTGTITTFAGNGAPGSLGDGGPATSASLSFPRGVSVDGNGNVYIADAFNFRIRRVSPDGVITTVAGTFAGFLGDGGPAAKAQLKTPVDLAADAAGNLYIADGGDVNGNDRIRKVWATVPSFAVSPATLDFRAPAGAPAVAEQRISVLSEAFGLRWAAQASTASGNWLSVTPASGAAPGVIAVSANVTNLQPGAYTGTITVNAPLANPPVQTVAVSLTVEAALSPKLVAEPLALTFETQTGVSSLPTKTLRISNGGSGAIPWTARAKTTSGGNWLEITPGSGSVSPGSPLTAQVLVVPGTLVAGVYTGSILLESQTTGQTETVGVTLLVEQPAKTLLLSQAGLLFTGVEGGGAVPSDTFGIVNVGEGEMVWTVEATTLSGGPNWLTVSPREGRSVAGSLRVPRVEVGVNASGMKAGQYNGLVRVNALGAANSPQFATVTLEVLPPGSHPGVVMRPSGMIFAAQAGTSSPGSQTLRLSTAGEGQIEARSGLFTSDGGQWIEILPPNAVLSAEDPRTIVVQPVLGTLGPGVYRGQLALSFSDGSPTQRVDILFLVVSGPIGVTSAAEDPATDRNQELPGKAVEGCEPKRLHAVFRTLTDNFSSPLGWPTPIEALVVDDCGNAVTNATVVASFSNGDLPLVLTSLRNGFYVGTWKSTKTGTAVSVTVRAELPPLERAEVKAQGQVRNNPNAPALFQGGIVSGASFARDEAVAPGSIISVFGSNLTQGDHRASRLPLETTLGGVTLTVGGIDAPLFYSGEGQVNAQLPFELPPNSQQQVLLKVRKETAGPETVAVPEVITVATTRPAIFTLNQQGTGQGAILNQDNSPNSASNPAARGGVAQIFATGLGATNPAVASGQAAPSDPPAVVTNPVTVTLGEVSAPVQFQGLAPGFVGLYQINVEVPAAVAPGPEVAVVLTQNGVASNTVTVAVQ